VASSSRRNDRAGISSPGFIITPLVFCFNTPFIGQVGQLVAGTPSRRRSAQASFAVKCSVLQVAEAEPSCW
jgi:hypothetical protein